MSGINPLAASAAGANNPAVTTYNYTKIPEPLDPRSLKKQADLLSKIPKEWRIPESDIPPPEERKNVTGEFIEAYLTEAEREITNLSAETLVRSMARGELRSVDVAKAFCHRAAVAHQLVNCLMEIMFVEALRRAANIDAAYEETGKQIGYFHGLPISLKDQFHVKGVDTCMGYVGWIGTPDWNNKDEPARESELVREINLLGGVLYCKTNVPVSLMFGETMNHVMGWTSSPFNRMLTSGGSSGGEGALIGLGGSPLGVGTDIGGSIRIPSTFNNLYGLRPSHGRFPYMRMANSMPGQPHVPSVLGPMSPHLSSLKFFTRGILSVHPWETDPEVVELPWREQHYIPHKQVCLGVMAFDGDVTPQPPVQRALRMVVEAVEAAGIKIVEWKPPKHDEGVGILGRIYTQDGGADVHAALRLGRETVHPQTADAYGFEPYPAVNATAVGELTLAKRAYCERYAAYWNSTRELTGTGRPVDAVIMPVTPYAGCRPGQCCYYAYTSIINLLDYSSVTIPVTFADKVVDKRDSEYEVLNPIDELTQEQSSVLQRKAVRKHIISYQASNVPSGQGLEVHGS